MLAPELNELLPSLPPPRDVEDVVVAALGVKGDAVVAALVVKGDGGGVVVVETATNSRQASLCALTTSKTLTHAVTRQGMADEAMSVFVGPHWQGMSGRAQPAGGDG